MPRRWAGCSTRCGIRPEILLGRMTAAEKAERRKNLASGAARLVVGTHALLQESTAFKRLGLVVIDEQHRFGVEQRAALIGKGAAPDVLLLSATPIPRSLALTLYGDLDVSVLKERPPGRGEVHTAVRMVTQRERVFDFVHQACAGGRQAYIVFPGHRGIGADRPPGRHHHGDEAHRANGRS